MKESETETRKNYKTQPRPFKPELPWEKLLRRDRLTEVLPVVCTPNPSPVLLASGVLHKNTNTALLPQKHKHCTKTQTLHKNTNTALLPQKLHYSFTATKTRTLHYCHKNTAQKHKHCITAIKTQTLHSCHKNTNTALLPQKHKHCITHLLPQKHKHCITATKTHTHIMLL